MDSGAEEWSGDATGAMPNVTIRAAGPADAGALARLRFEFRA
jgi:hypothetical protein